MHSAGSRAQRTGFAPSAGRASLPGSNVVPTPGSRVPRLRVPLEHLAPGERALPKEAGIYVTRVYRLGAGDTFLAFDPSLSVEADATVIASEPGKPVLVRLEPPRPARAVATRPVTLFQALSKGDKVDAIVRDATELGATDIFPVVAERSVSTPKNAEIRRVRFQKIAIEAARQCGRGDAPTVHAVMPLAAALTHQSALGTETPLRVCLAPNSMDDLGDMLCTLGAETPFAFVVGPEGGLSPAEIDACQALGFRKVTLGPFVLRTETVCAAVLGALLISAPRSIPR